MKVTFMYVCRPDGKVEVEENGQIIRQEPSNVPGFVVDTQPDLRVSRILPWLLLGRCFYLSIIFVIILFHPARM